MKLNEEIRQAKIASVRAALPKAITPEQLAALHQMLADLLAAAPLTTPEQIGRNKIGRPRRYNVGDQFGHLTITAREGYRLLVSCDCGRTEIPVTINALTQGGKRDCGARGCTARGAA